MYGIEGYNLFRNDRVTNTIGGGIAKYCKASLKAKVVGKSLNTNVEYLILEIFDSNIKCLVACGYNPQRVCSSEPFFSYLSEISPQYNNVFVCGDFNLNLLVVDSYSHQIKDLIWSNGLSIVNTSVPTCFRPNSQPSLVDLFIVSDPVSVLLSIRFLWMEFPNMICFFVP